MTRIREGADPAAIAGLRVAVIGWGAQGRPQALNLRDSGLEVCVGLREGSPSVESVRSEGLEPRSVAGAVRGADLVFLLVPDEAIPSVLHDEVLPHLAPGAALVFAHGYAVHHGLLSLPQGVDVLLVAPLAQGDAVRSQFVAGAGVPALVAVHTDASGAGWARAMAIAHRLGAGQAAILETTFAEETETDLFAEQAVLVGGVNQLIRAAFETLVEAGYPAEIAYFSCLHELKAVIDLVQREGLAGERARISNTAEFGAEIAGPRIVGEPSRAAMREVLAEIRSGAFARAWHVEGTQGLPTLRAAREAEACHPLETVGRPLRDRMPWLRSPR
jgi:ketol-acid reductoisomerase